MQSGSKRVAWVDLCRGLAMILVVIGHTVAVDTTLRFVIFTFHMPILFIIAGYVFRPIEIKKSIVKYAKKLLIPLYAGAALLFFYRMLSVFLAHGGIGDYKYWIKRSALSTIFASGVGSPLGFPEINSLGMLWFLAAMFWAMLLFNIIIRRTEEKNSCKLQTFLCVSITVFGYLLARKIWLPMNIDISMMSIAYLYVGYRIKKGDFLEKKEALGVGIISALLWWLNFVLNGKIEMAQRDYRLFLLSFVASIGGSYVVMFACKKLYQKNVFTNILCFIGQNSLVFLLFHFIDSNMVIWQNFMPGDTADPSYLCILIQCKILFILAGVVCWTYVKKVCKNLKEHWLSSEARMAKR